MNSNAPRDNGPLALKSNEGLGPLPPQRVLDTHLPTGIKLYGYSAADMSAFATEKVAAERERWMRLVRERLDATVMSCYASTKECEAARAALRGVLVYENAA